MTGLRMELVTGTRFDVHSVLLCEYLCTTLRLNLITTELHSVYRRVSQCFYCTLRFFAPLAVSHSFFPSPDAKRVLAVPPTFLTSKKAIINRTQFENNRMRFLRFFVGLLLLISLSGFLTGAAGQPDGTDQLRRALADHGFENLTVIKTENRVTLAYENRVYRSQHRALAEVLKIAAESDIPADTLRVVVLYREQPVTELTTSLPQLRELVNGTISYSSWVPEEFMLHSGQASEELKGVETGQRTRFRPEIPIGLGMRYQLGNYDNPYRFAFDLQPALRIPLGWGLTANARMAVPLYNNFDTNTFVRPSLISLTWEKQLMPGLYAAGSTGIFSRNRRGWHAMVKSFLWEEVFSVTVEGGQTLYTPATGNVSIVRREDDLFNVLVASADYRWRRYDLNVRVQYGQFLYNDRGGMLDIHRHFGDATVGFFYISTSLGENYGFRFSLPLLPRKNRRVGPVTIRPAERFPVMYRYQGNDQRARLFETGITIDRELMEFYPSFLQKEMEQWF